MNRQLQGLATLAGAVVLSACSYQTTDEETSAVMGQNVYSSCNSNSGLNPTKAALAVAMATELGRLTPAADLEKVTFYDAKSYSNLPKVALKSSALSSCSNGCKNTLAILDLQMPDVSNVVDQSAFNPTSFREDMVASLNRQASYTASLAQNSPWLLPETHTLVRTGGPTNLGTGYCGPYYTFRATKPSGAALTSPANLANNLVFFGIMSGNNYLSFSSTSSSIGLDPTDGDNALPVTTSGSCPSYENDRVFDPGSTLLNSCCITSVTNVKGAMQPIRTAGYLGCKAGATSTGTTTPTTTTPTTTTPTTTGEPCTPNAVLASPYRLEKIATTSAYCIKLTGTVNGWTSWQMTGRTILVNDKSVSSGGSLPAKVNSAYYFEISAGSSAYAGLQWW